MIDLASVATGFLLPIVLLAGLVFLSVPAILPPLVRVATRITLALLAQAESWSESWRWLRPSGFWGLAAPAGALVLALASRLWLSLLEVAQGSRFVPSFLRLPVSAVPAGALGATAADSSGVVRR